ncbi:hypothetical protein PVAND_014762 [Polypedilum vanderplanki]|uniref:Uncharacterized protein n=1 Tax=Polypedilum vanderplanki TaxID=319348 RepID=A0A9J6BAX4_POLVA|nr:hypothetical protein PVAND_014762 [Polypedilum vanderplanki]
MKKKLFLCVFSIVLNQILCELSVESLLKSYLENVKQKLLNDSTTSWSFGNLKIEYFDCIYAKLNLTKNDDVKNYEETNFDFNLILSNILNKVTEICYYEDKKSEFLEVYEKEFHGEVTENVNEIKVECYKQFFMRLEPQSKLFDNFSNEKYRECLKTFDYSDGNFKHGKVCSDYYSAFDLLSRLYILKDIIAPTKINKPELIKKSAKFMFNANVEFYEIKLTCDVDELKKKIREK